MYSKEDLLFKALQVNEVRAIRFCKKVREPMLREARQLLSAEETTDLTQLEQIWYEGNVSSSDHYNWTRYYALNLHSVFYRGTVEWRCFNSTLNPELAAAYVNLCLAMSAQAIAQRSTIMRKTHSETSCSPSGCGWCAWASMAMSSGRPAICCWRIWMGTGPGASTRTAMKSIETRRKNIVRRRGDHEDTN